MKGHKSDCPCFVCEREARVARAAEEWATPEHKAFEEWARSRGISLSKNWDGDDYDSAHTKFAWWGWKARGKNA